MLEILCFVSAYIIGGIPTGLLLVKIFEKKDLRQMGSGNIGSTNVLRTASKKLALVTLFIDILKGFLPPFIALKLGLGISIALLTSVLAVLGQVFSCWLKFKGGKGVATGLGGLLFFSPWPFSLFLMLLWGGIFYRTRVSSLSTLASVSLAFLFSSIGYQYNVFPGSLLVYTALLTPLLFYSHRANIIRLLKKEEFKF